MREGLSDKTAIVLCAFSSMFSGIIAAFIMRFVKNVIGECILRTVHFAHSNSIIWQNQAINCTFQLAIDLVYASIGSLYLWGRFCFNSRAFKFRSKSDESLFQGRCHCWWSYCWNPYCGVFQCSKFWNWKIWKAVARRSSNRNSKGCNDCFFHFFPSFCAICINGFGLLVKINKLQT